MKSKKFITSIIVTIMCFSLVGCNSTDTTENKKEDTSKPKVESTLATDSTNDTSKVDTNTSESTVHFINTGNSDSILIKGEKSVLIDGGDNDDEKLIVDYLEQQGIKELEYVIATHPDADHCGGLDAVFENVKVNNLLVGNSTKPTKTYQDFIKSAANKGVNGSTPLEGAKFNLESNSYLQIFNVKGGSDPNESSLITLYVNGKDKFLLTGDAGEESEKKILNDMIDVDVLKVGHHGSKTSTSQEFLDKIKPEYAIITCGKDNNYGHPHKETMDRLSRVNNLNLHRTDECGTIVFKSTGNGVSTDCKSASFEAGKKENISTQANNDDSKATLIDENERKIDTVEKTEKYVWLSATGSKYHSINNCGKMNPSKARKVSLKEVQGVKACSKCN